jgi:Tol biopolymer transport system component
MPDVREAFEAVSAPPEPGARERQQKRQRRAARNRQLGAFAVAAAIAIGIVVLTLDGSDGQGGSPRIADEPSVDAPAVDQGGAYLLQIGDGTMTPFRAPADGRSYRFSPDGSKVAFTALDEDGIQTIYVMNADGTAKVAMTDAAFLEEWGTDVDEPAWSPDGEWLLISGTEDAGYRSLYFLSVRPHFQTGTHAPPRSGTALRDASEPAWSPDGDEFTFTAEDGSLIEIASASPYAGGRSMTTSGFGHTFLTGAASLSWSPDGAAVVFVATDTGRVSVAGADGSDVHAITDAPGANPAWSPDGMSIAYDDVSSGRIAIYDTATGSTRHLDVNACLETWADDSTLLVITGCER